MKKKDRRLTNILLVCGLTTIFGIHAFTTNDIAKPIHAEAENQEYTLTTTLNGTENRTRTIFPYDNTIYYQESTKINFSNGNFAVNLNGTYYDQGSHIYTSYEYLARNHSQDTQPNGEVYKYCTRMLYIMGLNSYNVNTSTTVNFTINIQMGVLNDNTLGLKMERTTYRSTDNLSIFIDKPDYGSETALWSYLQDLENPANQYIYTKTTSSDNLQNDVSNQQTYSKTIMLTLEPNRTTYYIFLLEPYIQAVTYNTITAGTNERNIYNPANSTVTLTGTNVIPTGNYEIVDIGGLMFTILTMPFSFISNAFNLTLFPNTPYAVNLSNIFLAIIGVLVFVFIIKIIIRFAAGG